MAKCSDLIDAHGIGSTTELAGVAIARRVAGTLLQRSVLVVRVAVGAPALRKTRAVQRQNSKQRKN